MSRIDEALRRAAAAGPAGARGPRVDSSDLDRFVSEEPEPASPEERAVSPTQVVEPTVVHPRDIHGGSAGRVEVASKLIATGRVDGVSVEAYRRLAAALHEVQVERGFKTLVITSALPLEGRTLTVANLALTLSEAYDRRVLIMDADFRRPSIHSLFDCPNIAGLADVLRSGSRRLPVVEVSPRLTLLTAGRLDADPLAPLTSERMHALVKDVAEHFDWVLLDTPPVGLLANAQLLAQIAEAVVLVIAAGTTPYQRVQRSIEELGADRIVGAVLNRGDASPRSQH